MNIYYCKDLFINKLINASLVHTRLKRRRRKKNSQKPLKENFMAQSTVRKLLHWFKYIAPKCIYFSCYFFVPNKFVYGRYVVRSYLYVNMDPVLIFIINNRTNPFDIYMIRLKFIQLYRRR